MRDVALLKRNTPAILTPPVKQGVRTENPAGRDTMRMAMPPPLDDQYIQSGSGGRERGTWRCIAHVPHIRYLSNLHESFSTVNGVVYEHLDASQPSNKATPVDVQYGTSIAGSTS